MRDDVVWTGIFLYCYRLMSSASWTLLSHIRSFSAITIVTDSSGQAHNSVLLLRIQPHNIDVHLLTRRPITANTATEGILPCNHKVYTMFSVGTAQWDTNAKLQE